MRSRPDLRIYWAALLFGNDLLDSGEGLTVDLFENSASDTPFLSQSFAGGGTRTLLTDIASGWSDFQGVARVTMNQGTAELDGLNIFAIQNGVGHQVPAVVPEPSTLALGLLAGIAATKIKGKSKIPDRRRHRDVPPE
jgi:hypothetical protein